MKLLRIATMLFLAVCLLGAQQDNANRPTEQKSTQQQQTNKPPETTNSQQPAQTKGATSTTQTQEPTKGEEGAYGGRTPPRPGPGVKPPISQKKKGEKTKVHPAPVQKEEGPKK